MTDKVYTWMLDQQLVQPGQRIICAVSGGADSVCMLHVLLALQQRLGIALEAAHFNHHLRGEESDRDEAFVRRMCMERHIPLHLGSGEAAARAAAAHESVEEAARQLRYAFFDSLDAPVATAHTQDDNLETVLLNLTRGTGLRGLCGIPPKRGRIIRPMLCVSRAEIEAYLDAQHVPYVTDSTNLQPDARRNRLRQLVVPLLRQENPSIAQTAFRESRLLRRDEAYLTQQAQAALEHAKLPGGVSCQILSGYHDAVRTRAVRALLQTISVPKLSEAHIVSVDRLLFSNNPSAYVQLPGGWRAQRVYDLLQLAAVQEPEPFCPVTLNPDGWTSIPALGLRVLCRTMKNLPEIKNTLSTFVVKCDTMDKESPLVLRPRQIGDIMRVAGGTKSLKKLMIERRIPAAQRQLLPVLADTDGILGVYRIGVNLDRAAAAGCDARVIIIENEKEDKTYYD